MGGMLTSAYGGSILGFLVAALIWVGFRKAFSRRAEARKKAEAEAKFAAFEQEAASWGKNKV